MTTPRIGLVLGAGGTSGAHWIRGALDGLAERAGFRPENASVLIGTSIGAIKAAGIGPFIPPLPTTAEALAAIASPPSRPGIRSASLAALRSAGGRVVSVVSRPGQPDPLTWVEHLEPQSHAVVCSVRQWPPARRVSALATAQSARHEVAASAAIPFGAQPVMIDGERHIDGAVWSVTNADLATPDACDVLIVIAPLVAIDGGSLVSSLGRHQLAAELEPWRKRQMPVLVLAPTGDQYSIRHDRPRHRADGYALASSIG